MGSNPQVFLSYSHDGPAHRERVLALSERLRADGIDTRLDQYVNGTPAEGWPRWMLNQLDSANRCLLVCTPTYYRRFRGHEEVGSGRGVDWGGAVITQAIYHTRSVGTRFVPVCFAPGDRDFFPEPVRIHTVYCLDGEQAYQALYEALLDQAGVEPGPIGTPRWRPRQRAGLLRFLTATPSAMPMQEPDLSVGDRTTTRPNTPATQALAPGVLDWLASTLDHDDPKERVADDLVEGRGAAHPGRWFYAFDACLADCPRTLAEHLAVHLAEQCRGLSPYRHPLDVLVTQLYPDRYHAHGLWQALAARITPGSAPDGSETERILNWINTGPGVGPAGLRVIYCQLPVATKRAKIPDFIAGAIRDFGTLSGVHPQARLLFLFGCVYEEAGRWGFLKRLRPLRFAPACAALGALPEVSLADLYDWLGRTAQTGVGGRGLDTRTLQRLRDELEPLFPNDGSRRRYQAIQRLALKILAEAIPTTATPGARP
jgi:hypothetical protein